MIFNILRQMLNIVNALWVYSDKTKWFIAKSRERICPPFASMLYFALQSYISECEHIKCMSPFLTCFPHLPFGRALRAGQLDAIDFVAIAIPSLRSLRRAHVSRRPLIMPLVALVQKNHSAPATSYFRLVLGARHK